MSNAIAISAVTSTICDLLSTIHSADSVLSDTTVTAKPLDVARAAEDTNQLNLFLYQTAINAAWRNMDMPRRTNSGEVGQPPLPLNLHYLLTAYGRSSDELLTHRLMGRAMSLLHDTAVLTPQMLQQTIASHTEVAGEDLYLQVEGVRVIQQPLSLEELSKLWPIFQAKYRLTVSLQVSVVLIESTRPSRAALPVLRRGQDDQGVQVQAALALPYPALDAVVPPDQQPAARLGATGIDADLLVLSGSNLTGEDVTVTLAHALQSHPLGSGDLTDNTGSKLSFTLTDNQTDWPAGPYMVQVSRRDPGSSSGDPVRSTNALALLLAPRILTITPDSTDHAVITEIEVTCSPQVWPEQRVSLLVGNLEVPAETRTSKTDTLTFGVSSLPAGTHYLRLRVDGVDSLLVTYGTIPLAFDTAQKVVLT